MTAATFKVNSNRSTSRLLTALCGCLFAGALSVAHAAPSSDAVPTAVVKYGDLNISTNDGALVLYQRIAAAARRVCPPEDSRDLAQAARSNACRTAAVARAVREVHSQRLAEVYAGRSNRG
jgi:UrcA family protein